MINENPRSASEIPPDHNKDEREAAAEHDRDLHEVFLFLGSAGAPVEHDNLHPKHTNEKRRPRRVGSGHPCG